ncbi:hypothetical protein PIB30_013131 [Stylosanthes scabra]|uniref:Uncharacterized protein n=1 Tax=Stylosanthes scabra TaxID=79078 RepID=A0ABU6X6Z3_9FABA|nr:hypothetical protein [Stylosanthes scabra]
MALRDGAEMRAKNMSGEDSREASGSDLGDMAGSLATTCKRNRRRRRHMKIPSLMRGELVEDVMKLKVAASFHILLTTYLGFNVVFVETNDQLLESLMILVEHVVGGYSHGIGE